MRTSKLAAREEMQRHGYDPIAEQVKIAMDPTTPRDLRQKIASDLLPYMYPRLNAITLGGDDDAPPIKTQSANMFMQLVLGNPELVDAASKLSLVAAESQRDAEEAARLQGRSEE